MTICGKETCAKCAKEGKPIGECKEELRRRAIRIAKTLRDTESRSKRRLLDDAANILETMLKQLENYK
nr:MAG TPA: hypothetical protein [Caudoviricetes sp.]